MGGSNLIRTQGKDKDIASASFVSEELPRATMKNNDLITFFFIFTPLPIGKVFYPPLPKSASILLLPKSALIPLQSALILPLPQRPDRCETIICQVQIKSWLFFFMMKTKVAFSRIKFAAINNYWLWHFFQYYKSKIFVAEMNLNLSFLSLKS